MAGVGETWPGFVGFWSEFGLIRSRGPSLVDLRPSLAKVRRICPERSRSQPTLGEFGPGFRTGDSGKWCGPDPGENRSGICLGVIPSLWACASPGRSLLQGATAQAPVNVAAACARHGHSCVAAQSLLARSWRCKRRGGREKSACGGVATWPKKHAACTSPERFGLQRARHSCVLAICCVCITPRAGMARISPTPAVFDQT